MDCYLESNEIPMFNLLKVFETNNYDWLIVDYYDNTIDFNYNVQKNRQSLVSHFMVIIGEFNDMDSIWRLLLSYVGLLNKLQNNKGEFEVNINEFRNIGIAIVNLILEENKMLEIILENEIDLFETSLFEWLAIRENTI